VKLIKSISQMQKLSLRAKRAGKKIGLVPTMGYLHKGHLELVKKISRLSDLVVVSIFVNPTQFGPKEDFNRYPRDLTGDLAKLKPLGVDYVFAPSAKDMYPEGYQTYVEVENLSKGLCGDFRPGHFRGVATVVCKLFNIVQPELAIFGEKDYQQLKVIERMSRDLNLGIKILAMATVREKDGLAMSSRNSYLSKEERVQAVFLSRALKEAKKMVEQGEKSAEVLIGKVREIISANTNGRIEYIQVRDALDLSPVERVEKPAQMLVAVWIGRTRLIDNIRVQPKNTKRG